MTAKLGIKRHALGIFLVLLASMGACFDTLPKVDALRNDTHEGGSGDSTPSSEKNDSAPLVKPDGNLQDVAVVIDAPVTVDPVVDAPVTIPSTKQPNGDPCGTNDDCELGHCVDKVCCDQACLGSCQSCKNSHTNKGDGICAAVAAGSDPYNNCADERSSKECGNDGMCDGSGVCRKVGKSHECAPASCAQSTFTPAATCDGLGSCGSVEAEDCKAFACTLDGCKKSCTAQAECGAAGYCNLTAKECATKKVDGKSCQDNLECLHGHCTDGVCCNNACTESCQACTFDLTGQLSGTCNPVLSGSQDPRKVCANANTTCGGNGTCNGSGGCFLPPAGSTCGTTCSGSTVTKKTCDGKGKCAGTGKACDDNLMCLDESQCRTSCTSNNHCITPYRCVGDQCTLCGGDGQTCCGTECNTGLVCKSQTCVPCGGLGQPCCSSSICTASGTTCSNGVCKKSNGVTCTNSTECTSGWCGGTEKRCCPADCAVSASDCKPGGCNTAGACLTTAKTSYYLDSDNDGYGNRLVSVSACVQPDGYETNSNDCDDSNPNLRPGSKTCNGISTAECSATGTVTYTPCNNGCWEGSCRPSTDLTIGVPGAVSCRLYSESFLRCLSPEWCAVDSAYQVPTCVSATQGPTWEWSSTFQCDAVSDCGSGEICCMTRPSDSLEIRSDCRLQARCAAGASDDDYKQFIVCDPKDTGYCISVGLPTSSCKPLNFALGFFGCQV